MYWGDNAQDTLLGGIIVSYENDLYSTFPLKIFFLVFIEKKKKHLGEYVRVWEPGHDGVNEGFGARETAWIWILFCPLTKGRNLSDNLSLLFYLTCNMDIIALTC